MALATGCSAAGVARASWTKVQLTDLTLYSSLPPQQTEKVARELDLFPKAFSAMAGVPLPATSPMPTRVFAFARGDQLEPFAPQWGLTGYVVTRSAQVSVALLDTAEGWDNLQPREVIYHELVHFLLGRSGAYYPTWYNEGLAELISTMRIDEKAGTIVLGKIPHRKYALDQLDNAAKNGSLPAFDPMHIPLSPDLTDVWYLQSWLTLDYLLVGHLTPATTKDRRQELVRYLQAYNSGTPEPEAFKASFGVTSREMQDEVVVYMRHGKFPYVRLPLAALKGAAIPTPVPVSECEMAVQLGWLSLDIEKNEQALALFRQAQAADPRVADAVAGEGAALARLGDGQGAERVLRSRLDQDPNNAELHERYAELLLHPAPKGPPGNAVDCDGGCGSQKVQRPDPKALEEARKHLVRAIELEPRSLSSRIEYGMSYLWGAPDVRPGIVELERVLTFGHYPEVQFALAQLVARTGDRARARAEAQHLLALPHLGQLGEQAQRFLAELDASDRPQPSN